VVAELIKTKRRAGEDDAAQVVVVTGVPGAFCAGTDLSDLATVPGESRALRGEAHDTDRWWPLVACPKPVIGAIDGPAVGMGAEFATQCDVRIATPNARFAWNFVHRGLVPDTGAGTWLLPRLVGVPASLRLLYSGEFVSAADAHALGFVAEVVPSEALEAAARAEADRFLAGSPLSTSLVKALVYKGLTASVEDHLDRHTDAMRTCFNSADHAEGVAAFLERRPPKFTGK
jgi:enoyl-CoA hydratase